MAAVNTAGTGPNSKIVYATTDATVPGIPRNVTAQKNGTSQIDLSWRAPTTDGGTAVTGYRIEVSEHRGGPWQTLVASTNASVIAYSHTGLAPASTRHYRISAINRVGVGRASGIVGATTDATVPDAPTGLTATATSSTEIDLAWVAPKYDGGAPVTGYRIEVSETGAAWRDLRPNTATTSTSFAHTGLQPGSQRFYRVSAINRAGTGEASGVASAATDDPVQRAGRLNAKVLPHVASAMASSTVGAIADRIDAVASGMGMARRMEMGGLSSMAASLSSPRAGGRGLGRHDRSGAATLPRRLLLPDAARRSLDGELGRGRVPQPGRVRRDRPRMERQPGERACRRGRARCRRHPRGRRGVALAGQLRLHGQDRREPGDRHLRHRNDQRQSLRGLVPGRARQRGLGDRRLRLGRRRGRGFARGTAYQSGTHDDRRRGRQLPAPRSRGRRHAPQGRGVGRSRDGGWRRADRRGHARHAARPVSRSSGRQGYRSLGGDEIGLQLEGGARYDNGDGINGVGMELGGGFRYANAGLGLTAEARGRLLIAAREGYEEWGVGGMVQFDPAARGSGLSVRLSPSYGDAASGLNQLWDRGVSDAVRGPDMQHAGRPSLDGEVAYGLPGFRGTPFGGFRLGQGGAKAFSSGVRYDLGSGLGLRVEGTRRESAFGLAEHSVGVRGRLRLR